VTDDGGIVTLLVIRRILASTGLPYEETSPSPARFARGVRPRFA